MENKNDITKKKVWDSNQMIRIISFVAIAVFTLTMIYNRFLIMEKEIETIDLRANKRYERMSSDRQNIWQEINKIKDQHKN